MSLTDALLLEAYPLDVWVSYRTNGIKGRGTQQDPLNGSTQALFDGVMDATGAALGINLYGCEQALVENNVVRVSRANPIQYEQCGLVNTFENQTPNGQLRRGYNQGTGRLNGDFVDRIEDVWVV